MLDAIKADEIAGRAAADITPADIVGYAERLGLTRKPQTVQNYLSHLGAVFAVARDAWDMDVDPEVMRRAQTAGKRLGLSRSPRSAAAAPPWSSSTR